MGKAVNDSYEIAEKFECSNDPTFKRLNIRDGKSHDADAKVVQPVPRQMTRRIKQRIDLRMCSNCFGTISDCFALFLNCFATL